MNDQKLYIIHGIGNDSVGLVGKITTPIAGVNGNIVDLRQDVMHGLFTIFAVVDFSNSNININELDKLVSKISGDTNLKLFIEKYSPVPRDANKKNILLILIGHDKSGIISTITKSLSNYNINIEFSQMVAREGVFLMELLVDINRCTLPVENLQKVLSDIMLSKKIQTMFQTSDVFNKKKRIIVFDIAGSFIGKNAVEEIIKLSGIDREILNSKYSEGKARDCLQNAAEYIDNLPIDMVNTIAQSVEISSATIELIQTLKIMGYKIVIMSSAFSFFTDYLKTKLGIEYAFGCELSINDDLKTLTSDIDNNFAGAGYKDKIISHLMEKESVEKDDITILKKDDDSGEFETPGFGLEISMKVILDNYNQRILSKENLMGIIGSFGIPRIG